MHYSCYIAQGKAIDYLEIVPHFQVCVCVGGGHSIGWIPHMGCLMMYQLLKWDLVVQMKWWFGSW